MNIEVKENYILIADRMPPGDRWRLCSESEVYESLTDTLQAYFDKSGFKGAYKLDPLGGALYAITTETVEIPQVKPKTYSIYGDVFSQGV
jgi:hypothetical protein